MNAPRHSRWLLACLATTVLQSCGGGGDDSPPPPSPAPAVTLSYPAPPAYTKGVAITALTPTVSGGPTSFAVSPALPAGLALNSSTGVISGTPTVVAAAAQYQLSASNSASQAAISVSITVNDVVPAISYPKAAYVLTTDVPITSIAPTTTGGAVVQWSLDAALPAGLTFDTATGQISGTPTQVAAAKPYVVTAQNSGGTATFNLSIGVQSGLLVDLGHGSGIVKILHNGSRLMSQDGDRIAILWNAQSGEMILRKDGCLPNATPFCIGLAGSTAVFLTTQGFDVRAASDGAARAQIPYNIVYGWKLSADGTYLCAWSATDLTCWSSTGTQLFTKAGDYRNSKVVATTTEVRVAKGAAGAQRIERLAIPSGSSTTTPVFPGTFHSWFFDGNRFLTIAGAVVTVYSSDGVQVDQKSMPMQQDLGGMNDWFYTYDGTTMNVYRVGASSTAEAVYAVTSSSQFETELSPSSTTVGILGSSPFRLVDFSGATPALVTSGTAPNGVATYGANTATDWAVGDGFGVLRGELTATPQRYTLGAALSIAGSPTRTAIATAAGIALIYDSQTRALETTLDLPDGSLLELSDDGSRLATGPANGLPSNNRTVRVYSLPSKTVLAEWLSSYGDPDEIRRFAFSGNGTVVGLERANGNLVTTLDGTPIWSGPATPHSAGPLLLSPDGMKLALADGGADFRTNTNVYVNGVFSAAAASAMGLVWLDDGQLLLNKYVIANHFPTGVFDGSAILNPAGQVLSTPPLSEILRADRVSSTSIYSPWANLIFDVPTGNVLFATETPTRGIGAVAGGYVVFASGPYVRSEAR